MCERKSHNSQHTESGTTENKNGPTRPATSLTAFADPLIHVPTTLVLGAGSSAPYGPPTSDVLRSIVLANCAHETSPWMPVFRELEVAPGDVLEFRDAFWRS